MADLYPVGTGTLSKDVDCPFCCALAGEDCHLQQFVFDNSRYVHLCRIKPDANVDTTPKEG